MKKLGFLMMSFAVLFTSAACSNDSSHGDAYSVSQQPSSTTNTALDEETSDMNGTDSTEKESKSLVVYFSWSGNTRNVALSIQEQTNSDIFEIIPATPYSNDYDTVVELAHEEQRNDARPAISSHVENIEQYDVIYVGFPNWWGDMPMILYTFFDTYDLSGKTIALFCTSGGSGLSNSISEVKELEPHAVVTEGLHIRDNAADNPESAVNEWLNDIRTD